MSANLIRFNIKIRQGVGKNTLTDCSRPNSGIMSNNFQADNCTLKQLVKSQNQLNDLLKTFLKQNISLKMPETTAKEKIDTANIQPCIRISNQVTKQRMKYGNQFKEMLDPRDRVLQHDFDFCIEIDSKSIKENGFLRSKTYADIVDRIRQFLVQTLANILSVSLRGLNENQLEQKQVKSYAASNIMLNIQSLYKKTIEAIVTSKTLNELGCFSKEKESPPDLQQLKIDLIVKIQNLMKSILTNQDPYYPQAPITGGSLKMKNVVHQVNRTDDQENDLIYSNGIKISKHLQHTQYGSNVQFELRKDEDYTQFIMEVVNCTIKVVQAGEADSRDRVNKQIFTQFNRQLFALSQNEQFKGLVQLATNNYNSSQAKKVQKTLQQAGKQNLKQARKQAITGYFQLITQSNNQQHKVLKDKVLNNSLCSNINKQREKNLQQLKDYAIGIKIPNYVKQFTKQQMAEKQFRAKHSSVLRILTKWAENLEEIMFNPEQHIIKRLYPYKDFENRPISITDEQIKAQIVWRMNMQQETVRQKLKRLKTRNLQLISQIVTAKTDSIPSFVYRFSNTRQVSSKINAALTSLMVQYLSVLIHHLLTVGKSINIQRTLYDINLVMFKVSDLMRARFKCSQSSFIALLKTMYLLDQSKSMKGKFKLVRIKNKLEESANNVMINYMFMGKVQCQLQLSIQESKGKQKNYFILSHFIYQLRRGNFGILSQCAIMISQLDPIVANSCDEVYYQEKKQEEMSVFKKGQIIYHANSEPIPQREYTIFYCANCKKLTINQKIKILEKTQGVNICMKCLFSQQGIESKISQSDYNQSWLKQSLLEDLTKYRLKRIANYQHLEEKESKYYLRINYEGKMYFEIALYVPEELKYYMIKVHPQLLTKIANKQEDFDYSEEIDYVCISKLIKKKKPISDCFLFEIMDKEQVKKYLSQIGFKTQKFYQEIDQFVVYFQCYMKEKYLIESIKFKAEIISFSNDEQKWLCFNRILKIYSNQDNQAKESQIKKGLKYRKYQQLQFQKIKKLIAQNNSVSSSSQQLLHFCHNLEEIKITNSYLMENVDFLKKITSINCIQLPYNSLSNIDGLRDIRRINELNISHNNLQNVEGLINLTAIETLDLRDNQLQNINGLYNLKNIRQLYLDRNNLQNVDDLINCTNIEKLSLAQNQLQNLQGLSNLRHINTLLLDRNKLQNLDGLVNCIEIQILRLNQNNLNNLNGLKNIRNIKQLHLGYNQLQNVNQLSNCTDMLFLDLQYNRLKNVNGLHNCIKLTDLHLNNNNLQTIDAIKNISTLTSLNLMYNQQLVVESLPPNILSLTAESKQLMDFDFKNTPKLQWLTSQKKDPQSYKNIGQSVRFIVVWLQRCKCATEPKKLIPFSEITIIKEEAVIQTN